MDFKIEDYYFSVVDVIGVLTGSNKPNRYWSDLKRKLKEESSEPYDNTVRLKLLSADSKKRLTDVANTQQL